MTAYLVDLGYLLPKNDREYVSYLAYDYCHSFYDDNQYYVLDEDEAKRQASEWVGDKNYQNDAKPYGVVSQTEIDDSVLAEAEADAEREYGDSEKGIELIPVSGETYDPADVVYAITLQDNTIVPLPMKKKRAPVIL